MDVLFSLKNSELLQNQFFSIFPEAGGVRQKFFHNFFLKISVKIYVETQILEELWIFERHQHVRLEKWPRINLISALYDFWRRGKSGTKDFFAQFSAKNEPKNFNLVAFWMVAKNDVPWVMMVWWYDDMLKWWYDDTTRWWYDDTAKWKETKKGKAKKNGGGQKKIKYWPAEIGRGGAPQPQNQRPLP